MSIARHLVTVVTLLWPVVGLGASPDAAHAGRPNRLIDSGSPYLLQHAHNPVDWYPWGEEALATALDEVEGLLRSARAERRAIEVEIVANSSGLDLLADASPYARRVAALRKEYPNLGLVACGQTIARRRAGGLEVNLVPGTAIAPSALEQVIERLRSGWIYVRA